MIVEMVLAFHIVTGLPTAVVSVKPPVRWTVEPEFVEEAMVKCNRMIPDFKDHWQKLHTEWEFVTGECRAH